MSIPTTRETFKDHCLRRLGWPVIDINVDDDQVDDRIDEALQMFQQFHFDATERTYLKHQITQTDKDNGYIPVSAAVKAVTRVFSLGNSTSNMNMFDLRYQIRLNDMFDMTQSSFSHYVLMMQHLRNIEMLFVGEVPIRFNQHTNRVYIDWDWGGDVEVGEWVVAEAFVTVDPATYPDVWSDKWLQSYSTALIKKQWGNNMKKFVGVKLPGGITMDGQTIFNEATEEIRELENEAKTVYQEPPNFLVG
jgi:hypothetical protein